MEVFYYHHKAVQRRTDGLIGSWEEDKLFIRLKLYKCGGWRLVRSDPVVWDYNTELDQIDFWVKFSDFKQQLRDNNDSNREYETLICQHLKNWRVPEDEHPFIVQSLFNVVEAAVSPVDPVVVRVSDVTLSVGVGASRPNLIPASRSSIQTLEPVTVFDSSHSTCAICLDDFEGKPITRLPCTHHFHVDCIVQWLEINHLCPFCRYPMPKQEDPAMPTQEDPAMPTQEDPAMPTQEDPAMPTQQDPAMPTQQDPAMPTQQDPAMPTQQDPAMPTQQDPAMPTQEDQLSPAIDSVFITREYHLLRFIRDYLIIFIFFLYAIGLF
uniref:E3 ubiquitin-protein ligase DZIP3-like n=1 Tax=Fragaria vesca subsp. vesca TaxID=101020 RepID=UPI0005C7EF5F|nr:PREDICTED: E3 ubiquitin-protein ligase DZIP3-like [Fragaria vesca subsp. vesca]